MTMTMFDEVKQATFEACLKVICDKGFGHAGTIYKASNFHQEKDIKGAKVIVHNGKRYHDKAVRAKYKGRLKSFAQRLKDALASGEAKYIDTKGKHTYTYLLK